MNVKLLNVIAFAVIVLLLSNMYLDSTQKTNALKELIAEIRRDKCDALDISWRYIHASSVAEYQDVQKKLIILSDSISNLGDLKKLINRDNKQIDRLQKVMGRFVNSTRQILISELFALEEIQHERQKLWGIGYCGVHQRVIMTQKRQSKDKNKQFIEAFLVDYPDNIYTLDSAGYKRRKYKIHNSTSSQIELVKYEYELTTGDTIKVTLPNNI